MTSDLTDHLVGATPRPAQNPFPSDALNWVENQVKIIILKNSVNYET